MARHFLLASLGLLLATTANGKAMKKRPFDCDTNTAHAPSDYLQTVQELHEHSKRGSSPNPAHHGSLASRATSLLSRDTPTNITVDAVFHIVGTEETKSDITDNMPSAQLDALNKAYNPYGISFNLINVTWNVNDEWAAGGGDVDTAMKKALRQGTYSTLNLYFQTELAGGVLGRCTLPSSIGDDNADVDPGVYASDGCNVNANTMPDGLMDGFNHGMTAVHETGHWLGLLHTFEGYSCEGPGDFIDDTRAEMEATDGCPIGKSTCPGGEDPIHNFMDYSVDECYRGFSDGQILRVKEMWGVYRQGR